MIEQTQITVRRSTRFPDRFRNYQVMLDGKIAGSVGACRALTVPAKPGRQSFVLRIDWCCSEKVDFDCGRNCPGLRVFFVIFYVLFFSQEYLWVQRAE